MLKERKTVLIIGGGIAGLSAGVYAEQNGFHAIIFEKHLIPGGLCTGWTRKGHYIDGCTHWLNGTKEGTCLYKNWLNLGAFKSTDDIVYLPSWGTYEFNGKSVTFWTDLEKAEKEWIEVAPEDKRMIKRFFKATKQFSEIELPLENPSNKLPFRRMCRFIFDIIPRLFFFLSSMKCSKERYCKKFKSPVIRNAITYAQPGGGNMYQLFYSYGSMVCGNGGIPKGGSIKFAANIKNRFEELGGTFKANCPIKSIKIENKVATGVILEDGTEIKGDYIVPACDENYVLTSLLDNKYSVPKFDKRIYNLDKHRAPSCCLVSFVVKDMPELPVPFVFPCEPFYVGNQYTNFISLRSYAYDKETYVKNNKTVVQVLVDQDATVYDYWENLYQNKFEYNRKKQQIGKLVMGRILTRLPELKGKIELLDVATPKTLNRYTNATCGAFNSFLFTEKAMILNQSGMIKGIKNLYLAGQWVMSPGGLPLATSTGKFAIQRICRKENLKFGLVSISKAANKI